MEPDFKGFIIKQDILGKAFCKDHLRRSNTLHYKEWAFLNLISVTNGLILKIITTESLITTALLRNLLLP